MALIDNLVSYYKLDEASGTRHDAHGSNDLVEYPGTLYGVTGVINDGAECPGYASLIYQDGINLGFSTDQDFTVAGWAKFLSGSNFHVLLQHPSGFSLFRYSNDHIYCQVLYGSGSWTQIGPATGISNSTWYYVVTWHDSAANEIGLQINNGTPITTSHSAGTTGGSGRLQFGTADMHVDEWGIWTRTLNSTERGQLYNSGAGLAYPFSGGGGGSASRRYYFDMIGR